jgi:hypothetical protein
VAVEKLARGNCAEKQSKNANFSPAINNGSVWHNVFRVSDESNL